jgi:tetratricopeptide (TPR) repeat protein
MTDHFDEWLDFPELVDYVQELMEIGLLEDALVLLDRHQQVYHDEWELYFLYSRYFSEKNEPAKASQCLHKGLLFDKTNPDLLLGLFYIQAMTHNPVSAGRYLLRAAKYHPSNEQIQSALIWYYSEIGQLDSAISLFERLDSEGTTDPETYRNGGIAYQRSGQYDLAEECFKKALQYNPAYEEVVDILADQYVYLEKAEKAITLYRDVLAQSPRNLRILSRLVFCNIQAQQYDQASSIAKDIIRLYPNSPVGYVDSAYVYMNTSEYEKALDLVNKALDVSPIDAEALRLRGLVYSEKKEKEIAEASFESAIALEPENIEIIRDYYTHLRNTHQFDKMHTWVSKVIEQNQYDCLEEYWFLADFYRDQGENLKSFHFLHKAFKGMPYEKELIPPMAEILIEQNHIDFSFPILLRYVEHNGWNEIMREIGNNKKLRGKWSREGLNFLRYWSPKSTDYREYIFNTYLQKFLFGFTIIITILLMFPVWLIAGNKGLLTEVIILGLAAGVYRLISMLTGRQFIFFGDKHQGAPA